MQAIKDWIRANPEQGRALMRENLSYIFFKELTGAGPLGALEVAVTPHGTVAADPNYVPLGAPVYLQRPIGMKSTGCGSRRIPAARSRAPTGSTRSGARGRTRSRSPAACRRRARR